MKLQWCVFSRRISSRVVLWVSAVLHTLLAALFLLILVPAVAAAKPLVADLSQYHIQIDSSFTGTRLLLFGSRNDIGDIIVVVRGPEKSFTVRKKEWVSGLWINGQSQHFLSVPVFYMLASSKPFKDIKKTPIFAALQIGLDTFVPPSPDLHYLSFAPALIRYGQEQHLYAESEQKVSFMGESLFKYVIAFPDNIPRGDYSADIYLFNDGQLSAMQSIPLRIEKIGFDAVVYDFAQEHSVLYGLCAIALALGIGWAAGSLMQRI